MGINYSLLFKELRCILFMVTKEFNDLIRIEWKTLDEIRDDVFKEIKKQRKQYGKRK